MVAPSKRKSDEPDDADTSIRCRTGSLSPSSEELVNAPFQEWEAIRHPSVDARGAE